MRSHLHHHPDELDELDTIDQLPPAPLLTVHEGTSLGELARMFVDLMCTAVGVVDDDERLVGIVTRIDLLGMIDVASATAVDAMSGIISLESDSSIECAAALMVLEGIGHLVVVSPSGEPVGVINALDIARRVASRAGYLAA